MYTYILPTYANNPLVIDSLVSVPATFRLLSTLLHPTSYRMR